MESISQDYTDEFVLPSRRLKIFLFFQLLAIAILTNFGILLAYYIFDRFWRRPLGEWVSVSVYGDSPEKSIPIAIHWAFGSIACIIGWFQLFPHKAFSSFSWVQQAHKWNGRIFAICTLITSVAGLVYSALNPIRGGVAPQVAFAVFGFLLLLYLLLTLDAIVRQRNPYRHFPWALRTLWLLASAPFYRILALPLIFGWAPSLTEEKETTYLIAISYCMFFPYLVAEVWLQVTAKGRSQQKLIRIAKTDQYVKLY